MVEPFLNTAFPNSSLAQFEGEVRYVPIIMPPGLQKKYTARSRTRHKERIVVAAPQLDYDAFLAGPTEKCLLVYLSGLRESTTGLKKLGASDEQTADFLAILDKAFLELREQVK